jgi:thiamine biosynthesis lipoprotein
VAAPAPAQLDQELITPNGMVRRGFESMGTSVSLLLPDDRAAEAFEVERVFATWHATCSRFDPDSELSRLNRAAGRPVIVGQLLLKVLVAARRAAVATDGLFDPTLLRSLEAIGYDRDFAEIGDQAGSRLAGEPPATGGWRAMTIEPTTRTVCLPPGSGLDLGGLAKGMAVDAALAGLAARGVTAAVVDAGGDLAVLGMPPGSNAWPVAVEGPHREHLVSLPFGALATSSTARRRWRQGHADRHHLIDPRTGVPSDSPIWSVTVAAASCAQAEVAAKAALLLGVDDGARFLADRGLAGLFIGTGGDERKAGPWTSA